jgi:hypothetical protein
MRRIGRLLIVLAVLLPVGVVASGAANGASGGVGPAVLKCMHFKDDMIVSPGVTNTPTDQAVSGHGRLYGCNKAGGSGQFSATMHMSNATCADLSMAGSTRIDWANGKSSWATLTFTSQVAEPNKVFITGVISSGMFTGLVVQAWVRFTPVFRGTGAPCSPTNPLRKILFTNSQSYQLLTPPTTTSTVPQQPTTTTEPGTTSTQPPATTTTTDSTSSTVPISTQGSTVASTVPVTGGGSTNPPRGGGVVVVSKSGGTGGLAFTGSNRLGALLGLESLIVGGALACYGADRRRRRLSPRSSRFDVKRWLHIELPPTA